MTDSSCPQEHPTVGWIKRSGSTSTPHGGAAHVPPYESPEDWQPKKLTELAEYLNGYAFKPEDWGKDGLPIIRIEQLKNPESVSDFYKGRLPPQNIIDDGDLVFSWSASLFLRIWAHGRAALNQHLFKVVEKPNIDRFFLKQFIEYHLPEITKASHGSTMQHITRKELDRFSAPFPVAEVEQTKIAEVLSTVDQAIEQTEALIAKQQRIKTGLMQDLLTRGIDEHGNLRSEETHEFKDSPLGRMPVEWEFRTIGNSCDVLNNLRKPISALERESMQGEFPYYGPTGILDYLNEYRVDGRYMLIGEDGDHFLKFASQEMTLLIEGKCNVNNHAHIIRGGEAVETQWLHLFFLHRDITYFLTRQGAGRFKLNKSTLLSLPFTMPTSTEEQKEIVKVANGLRNSQRANTRDLDKLRSIKKALMQNLLTGERRVTPLLEPEIATVETP